MAATIYGSPAVWLSFVQRIISLTAEPRNNQAPLCIVENPTRSYVVEAYWQNPAVSYTIEARCDQERCSVVVSKSRRRIISTAV